MGRVLEALQRIAEGHPAIPADSPPRLVLHPDRGGQPPTERDGGGEEVPFIEVGPERAVEGSPCVLNVPIPKGVGLPLPVPLSKGGEESQTAQQPPSAGVREAGARGESPHLRYRELLRSLLAALPGVRRPALLFLSPLAEGEGAKIVVGLAAAATGEGRRVVVADGAGGEGVAGLLGMPRTPGLREVLEGEVSLDRALRATDQGLTVLPAGEAVGGEGLRFVAETMRSLLRQVRHRADLVLVAGPSDLQAATRLLAVCDGALLVLPEHEAESPRIDEMLQVIRERGTAVTGCVLLA